MMENKIGRVSCFCGIDGKTWEGTLVGDGNVVYFDRGRALQRYTHLQNSRTGILKVYIFPGCKLYLKNAVNKY